MEILRYTISPYSSIFILHHSINQVALHRGNFEFPNFALEIMALSAGPGFWYLLLQGQIKLPSPCSLVFPQNLVSKDPHLVVVVQLFHTTVLNGVSHLRIYREGHGELEMATVSINASTFQASLSKRKKGQGRCDIRCWFLRTSSAEKVLSFMSMSPLKVVEGCNSSNHLHLQ